MQPNLGRGELELRWKGPGGGSGKGGSVETVPWVGGPGRFTEVLKERWERRPRHLEEISISAADRGLLRPATLQWLRLPPVHFRPLVSGPSTVSGSSVSAGCRLFSGDLEPSKL